MKKGFTMIELIFVIVILGILAAVAIPKLTNVKGSAEQASAAQTFAVIIQDIANNSVARPMQNQDVKTWTDLTNAPKTIKVNGVDCITFADSSAYDATGNNGKGLLKDDSITFTATQNSSCAEFYKAPVLQNADKTGTQIFKGNSTALTGDATCTLDIKGGVFSGTFTCTVG